jgi:hypothetical protein
MKARKEIQKKDKMETKTKNIIIIAAILVVLVTLVLVLIFFFDICIFGCSKTPTSVDAFDEEVITGINNLFELDSSKKLVIGLGGSKMIEVKEGTDNFEVPLGFSPTNPDAWGIAETRCKYTVNIINQAGYCVNAGWKSPQEDVISGVNSVVFDEVRNSRGYAMIKINVSENIAPCTQRFKITVKCKGFTEATKDYFDLNVVDELL